MADVVWLSVKEDTPPKGYWDQALLTDTLRGLGSSDRTVVVIPGAYQNDLVKQINRELQKYLKVLVVITSDEENNFDVRGLKHPDMILYVNYPNRALHETADYFLPIGYTPDIRKTLREHGLQRKVHNWFFAGQVTHESRQRLVELLRESPVEGQLVSTEGFAQGMPQSDYYQTINYSKTVPAPGGPCSPDSFRMYEALEAGAIPIPENPDFFSMLFTDTPFPIVQNWEEINEYLGNFKDRYPELNNEVFAWWQWQKRAIRYRFEQDLEIDPDDITVIIPTSPIPSHPDTRIINETITSIRERLPTAEIIVMIDGVRDEQDERRWHYNKYLEQLLWDMNYKWNRVYPLYFREHSHQAKMTMTALNHIKTPFILFAEHDTPLNATIGWQGILDAMRSEKANVVRFHFEAIIPDAHKPLMLGPPEMVNSVRMIPTAQWSQRPHLASTEFYRKIMRDNFNEQSRTMIEDVVHGKLYNAFARRGKAGWNDWRVWIYAPEGQSLKFSLNLDGREDDPKYDMVF